MLDMILHKIQENEGRISEERRKNMAKQLEIRAHPDIKIIGTPHPERGIAYLLEGLIRKETGAEVRVEYIGDKKAV